jgi:hypothetical protein
MDHCEARNIWLQKVIPKDEVLFEGYRRRFQSAYLGQHFGELLERSRQHIKGIEVPPDLRGHVARLLEEQPELSWDAAVAEIVNGDDA